MFTQKTLQKEKGLAKAIGCIACGSDLSFLGQSANYQYKTCNNCLTVQINPIPSQEDIESAYSQSQFATHIHGQGNPAAICQSSHPYYISIANILSNHNISGLVIDYGAGWGGLCEVLIERGFKCQGIELAKDMVDECQKRKLPVTQQSLASLAKEGYKAQALTLCGVFEHLVDPRTFLSNAYDLIEDDGLLISLQPTATFATLFADLSRLGKKDKPLSTMFWLFDAPWHIALYSIAGMKQIAEECGFELVEICFSPQGRMPGFYGFAQRILEWINKIGWQLCQSRWPLLVSHTFVFKKRLRFR